MIHNVNISPGVINFESVNWSDFYDGSTVKNLYELHFAPPGGCLFVFAILIELDIITPVSRSSYVQFKNKINHHQLRNKCLKGWNMQLFILFRKGYIHS